MSGSRRAPAGSRLSSSDKLSIAAIGLGTVLVTVGAASLLFGFAPGAWIAAAGFVLAMGAIAHVIWLR